jgi:hypothetical protein
MKKLFSILKSIISFPVSIIALFLILAICGFLWYAISEIFSYILPLIILFFITFPIAVLLSWLLTFIFSIDNLEKNEISPLVFILFETLLFVSVAIIFIFSTPSEVVVDKQGEIDGMLNNVRAYVQKEDFWLSQISVIDSAIFEKELIPQRLDEVKTLLDKTEMKTNKIIEDYYKKNPKSKPSKIKQKADELREMANDLEFNEKMNRFEIKRVKRIEELNEIKKFIKQNYLPK